MSLLLKKNKKKIKVSPQEFPSYLVVLKNDSKEKKNIIQKKINELCKNYTQIKKTKI